MGDTTSLGSLGEAKVLIKVDWDSLNGELNKVKDKFSAAFSQTGKIMRNVGAAMTAGLTAPIGALIGKSVMAATRVNELAAVNQLLGKSAGYSGDYVKEQAETVQDMGIEAAASQEIIADFIKAELDLGDAAKVARVAQDAAVISGQNSTETTKTLTNAIITGRTELFKSAGMIIDLNQTYEDYAAITGRVSSELTEQEKIQARVNAVMEYGEKIAGAYATAMEDPGKVLRSYPRYLNDIAVALGQSFIPAFKEGIFAGKDILKTFKDMVSEGGALEPVIENLGNIFENAVDFIGDFLKWLVDLDPVILQTITNFALLGAGMGPVLMVGGQLLAWAGKAKPAIESIGKAFGMSGADALAAAGQFGIYAAAIAVFLALAAASASKTHEIRSGILAERESLIDLTGSYEDYLDSLDEYIKHTGLRITKDGDLINKMGAVVEKDFVLTEANFELAQSQEDIVDATWEANKALASNSSILGGYALSIGDWADLAAQSAAGYYDYVQQGILDHKAAEQAASDYYKTILDLAGQYESSISEIEEKQARLFELLQIKDSGGYIDGVWVSAKNATDEIENLRGELGELRSEMSLMANQVVYDMAMAQLAADELTKEEYEQLMALGVELGIYSQEAADTAIEEFNRAYDVWKTMDFEDKKVNVVVNFASGTSVDPFGIKVDQRASGGLMGINQAAIVGERGPELFIPKFQGSIIANSELSRNMSRGSSTDQAIYQDILLALERIPTAKENARSFRDALLQAIG